LWQVIVLVNVILRFQRPHKQVVWATRLFSRLLFESPHESTIFSSPRYIWKAIMSLEEHDELNCRCPPLGGAVPFYYCRTMNKKLPCQRIFQCWGNKFDVQKWLTENYSQAEIEQALTPDNRSRLQKILEIVDKVKSGREE